MGSDGAIRYDGMSFLYVKLQCWSRWSDRSFDRVRRDETVSAWVEEKAGQVVGCVNTADPLADDGDDGSGWVCGFL
jgi:hypothetical protein